MIKVVVHIKYFIFIVFMFSGFSYSGAFSVAADLFSVVTKSAEIGSKSQAFASNVCNVEESTYKKTLRTLIIIGSVVSFGALGAAWVYDRVQEKKERGSKDKDRNRPIYVIVAKDGEGESMDSVLNAVAARASG